MITIQRNTRPAPLSMLAIIVVLLGSAALVVSRNASLLSERVDQQLRLQRLQQPVSPGFAGTGWASPTQRAQIIRTISKQISAIKSNKKQIVWQLNSVDLRRSLESVENYESLMSRTYPEMVDSRAMDYGHGRVTTDGEDARIRVTATGMDGKTVTAIYALTRDSSGQFRINGISAGFQGQISGFSGPSYAPGGAYHPR